MIRTTASDASMLWGQPKPSVTTPMRSPAAPWPSASRYGLAAAPYCLGSRPSGPASTSSSSALSSTVADIGPVWSMVSSIGMIPV